MSQLLAALFVLGLPAAADPGAAADADEPSVYTTEGVLGSMRAGAAAGVGVPDGIRLSAVFKWSGVIAFGGAFSTLPSLTLPGTDATIARTGGEGFVRVHPFRTAFFFGIAGGFAHTSGTYSEVVKGQRIALSGTTGTGYVAPHLGFHFMLPYTLTLGFDAGVEIPIAASREGSLAKSIEVVTTKPIPVVHLFELGFAL